MLTYKANLVGIQVIVPEESYTSKCSFLDQEALQHHDQCAGKRVERGLFRAANGTHINADLNASYNIIRKVHPKAFTMPVFTHGVRQGRTYFETQLRTWQQNGVSG